MQEHYFLVEVPEFEPTTSRLDENERNWLLGYRWWHGSEIEASDDRFSLVSYASDARVGE